VICSPQALRLVTPGGRTAHESFIDGTEFPQIADALEKGIAFILARPVEQTGLRSTLYLVARNGSTTVPIMTAKILASLLQLHGPNAAIQSDHQGIAALLNDLRAENSGELTQVYFRRGGFVKGPNAGAFRRAGYAGAGAFRRGGFVRGY
jgi:hypothetical protein